MNNQSNEYDFLAKTVFVGSFSVGKSSIITRYIEKEYTDAQLPTIGVDFHLKTMKLQDSIVKLQVWDTAGSEKFRTIQSSYYRGAKAVYFVFDVTRQETFNEIEYFIKEVENQCSKEETMYVLVGSKCDLNEERQVNKDEALQFAENNQMLYFECSAKQNWNIEQMFTSVLENVVLKMLKNKIKREQKIDCLQAQKKKKQNSLQDLCAFLSRILN